MLTLMLLATENVILGQDFSNVKDADPVKISGGLAATSSLYQPFGTEMRSEPFIWALNGNLNINLYGWNIPLSANVTQQDQSYTQPFNQYGASPKYKWLTLHGGYRSMQFSTYTYSGMPFLGGGVEIRPENKNLEVMAMYGRLKKAVPYIKTPEYLLNQPAYERWGYGSKVKLGKERTYEFIFFKAKDDASSVDYFPDSLQITPDENLILGFNTKQKITKVVTFNLEYSSSAYTRDIRQPKYEFDSRDYYNNLGSLFATRQSTQFNSAIIANINVGLSAFNFGFSFKQIDPEYRSLGTPFLSNDLREYTINLAKTLLKGKVNLSGNGGLQTNNLSRKLQNTTTRMIGAVNASINISDQINTSFGYSNNNSEIAPAIVSVWDTVKMVQIAQNGNASINYSFGKANVKNTITFSSNLSEAIENYEYPSENMRRETMFYNLNLGYNISHSTSKISGSVFMNYNETLAEDFKNSSIGPSISMSKPFFKDKMNLSCGWSNSTMYSEGSVSAIANAYNINGNVKVYQKHALGFNSGYIIREAKSSNSKSISELRGSISYKYSF